MNHDTNNDTHDYRNVSSLYQARILPVIILAVAGQEPAERTRAGAPPGDESAWRGTPGGGSAAGGRWACVRRPLAAAAALAASWVARGAQATRRARGIRANGARDGPGPRGRGARLLAGAVGAERGGGVARAGARAGLKAVGPGR